MLQTAGSLWSAGVTSSLTKMITVANITYSLKSTETDTFSFAPWMTPLLLQPQEIVLETDICAGDKYKCRSIAWLAMPWGVKLLETSAKFLQTWLCEHPSGGVNRIHWRIYVPPSEWEIESRVEQLAESFLSFGRNLIVTPISSRRKLGEICKSTFILNIFTAVLAVCSEN
jgi:hypothetical protein